MAQTKVTDDVREVTEVDAAKITTGTIPEARITSLAASKLTGTVDNARISLDAAEIPNISTDKLTSGELANDRVAALPASKITSGTFDNARISEASVTQHVAAVDLTAVHQAIATLALHTAVADNKAAYNLPNAFIDTFEDDTGVTTQTDVSNVDEYFASIYSSSAQFTSDANTKLLMHMDDSALTTDSGATGHTVVNTSVVRKSDQSKFGGYSAYFNNSSYLTVAHHADWTFGTGDFTIEFWFRAENAGGNDGMFDLNKYSTTAQVINVGAGNLNTQWDGLTVTPAVTTGWHHVALTKQSGTIRAYKDGVQYDSASTSYNQSSGNGISIGTYYSSSYHYAGYIDEVRVSNINRYPDGTTFTPNTTSDENATGTLVSTVQTAPVATTTLSGVILYTDEAGTNTLGSSDELAIYLTANLQGTTPNWTGTNWTEAASYGTPQTFSGTTKQVKLGKTTVTSGTQVAMKAVWANQAVSVDGVGLYQDSSSNAHTITAVADATTSTSIKKVGSTSLQMDGTGDWFTIPDGSWADIGTGDFTMEAWIYTTATSAWRGIIGSGNFGGPTTYDWSWDINMESSTRTVRFDMYNGSTEAGPTSATQIALSTWTHVAVVRSSGTIKQYFDGVLDGNTLSSTHNIQSHGVVYIGNQSRGIPWIGNIDEVRISNNARYTSAFTDFGQDGGTISSPTPFTSDANTTLLVHGEATAGVTGKVAQLNGWAVNY